MLTVPELNFLKSDKIKGNRFPVSSVTFRKQQTPWSSLIGI